MTGDVRTFAIDTALHPECLRTHQEAFGRHQLWVGGQVYGRHDEDASCLAATFDNTVRIFQERGSFELPGPISPIEALELAHKVIFLGDELLPMHLRPFINSCGYWSRRLLAPDGEEAFDDGAFVMPIEHRGDVIIAAAFSNAHGLIGPISEARMIADDFYQVLGGWINWYRTQMTE